MDELNKKIKSELDKYLEFDSSIIFEKCDKCFIYGGAIRDILANDSDLVNDIDIICAPISAGILGDILIDKGYKHSVKLVNKNINEVYKTIKIINEPQTFIKGDKIVQIIRPVIQKNLGLDYSINVVLKQVDISCCGVFWSGKKVYESYDNAIQHCINKIFYKNEMASMYKLQRTKLRSEKLINKSWTEIDKSEEIKILRSKKINEILI